MNEPKKLAKLAAACPSAATGEVGMHEVVPGDVVTQAELLEASELHVAAWAAEQSAEDAESRIETRLQNGASVEEGELYFDRACRQVKHKPG